MLKFRQGWISHLKYVQSFVTVVYFLSSFLFLAALLGFMAGSLTAFPVLITACIALAALCFDAYICLVQTNERLKGKK